MKTIAIINIIVLLLTTSQANAKINNKDLKYIMPSADSFVYKKDKFKYYEAYFKKELIGLCFLTTDIVTNSYGYNGPLLILIGIDTQGQLSGIKVLKHKENIEEAKQIETKKFEQQFIKKKISDVFNAGQDINNITGATITTKRLAFIVKQSANIMYQYYFKKKIIKSTELEEDVILKPKWDVEKVNNDILKNNSLSTQEAQFYQKVPK